jgi:hypothetical protein
MISPKPSNVTVHVDLTYSLVVVVVIFVICQMFNPIRRILEAAATSFSSSADETNEDETPSDAHFRGYSRLRDYELCSSFYFFYAPLVVIVVSLNSAVNCLVYAACGRKFRVSARRILTCRKDNTVHPAPAFVPAPIALVVAGAAARLAAPIRQSLPSAVRASEAQASAPSGRISPPKATI